MNGHRTLTRVGLAALLSCAPAWFATIPLLTQVGCTHKGDDKTPPTIATQPQSQTVVDGQPVSFTVTASGKSPFTYQWKKADTAISGANASTYTIPSVVYATSNGAQFSVDVTDANGLQASSQSATLTVTPIAPTVTAPLPQTVAEGATATFTVTGSGTAPLSYQWKRNGVNVSGTAATFTTAAVTYAQDNGASYTVEVTNGAGQKVTSAAAVLTVLSTAPTVTNPQSLTVADGQPAAFSVTATGSAPISYQWYQNNVPVLGATTSSFSIPTTVYARDNTTTFLVTVTNAAGQSVSSQAATLTITPLTTVLTGPTNQTTLDGSSATFTVSASGTAPFSYQWLRGGSAISGATSSSFTTSVLGYVADNGAQYAAEVTNGAGIKTTSSIATLTVTPKTTELSGPVNQSANDGATATFSVTATGTGPFTYQWLRGAVAINGATNASYTTGALVHGSDNAAQFSVEVTNAAGQKTTSSVATLTVNPIAPTFTTQPTGGSFSAGNQLTLNVVVSGTGPFTYQWTKDGVDIPSATSASYVVNSLTIADAGSYFVKVGGPGGVLTSQAAVVTVAAAPPTITVQPQTVTVVPPDSVTFTVTATAGGGGTPTYVWKKNGTAISGATSNTYTVATTEFATNSDAYWVTVSDGGISVDSNTVYAIASVTSPTYAGDPIPVPTRALTVLPSTHVDAVKFPNGAFRFGYDETLKNPVWSAYVNFPVYSPYLNSTADYTADTRLAAPQVGKDDYTGLFTSGVSAPDSYDRGHMVPRADISYRYLTTAGDDATIMSNLVPQISQLNQQTWQKLEDAIGGNSGGTTDGLTSFMGRVWVYTGSVFPASPTWWNSTATPGLKIAIPVGCYKIVVHEPVVGQPKVLAVLMPNAWGLVNSMATLTNYVTSVARIEALTGLNFFPNLSSVAPSLDIPNWKATVDVRGWRNPFEQTTGPNVHMIEPSYDMTIDAGTTVAFNGAATPNSTAVNGTTIATYTWSFGDGSPTVTGPATTHTYNASGTMNASLTVADSLGAINTITRVIKVIPPASSNTAPTTNPATLADKAITVGQTATVSFTVADDRTPVAQIVVSGVSDNTTLLPNAGANIAITNSNGSVSVLLIPAASQTGVANVTLAITDGDGVSTTRTVKLTVNSAVATTMTETFEAATTKSSYTIGNTTCSTGIWSLDDAVTSSLAGDLKNGTKSIRLRNGKITMGFDWPNGAQTVSIAHGSYGSDPLGTWTLWYSTDGGSTWTQVGGTITATSKALGTQTFTVGVTGNIRFQIRKADGLTTTRINFDDFQIVGY